jgi:cytochrome c oxidase cbb3-type subunit 3
MAKRNYDELLDHEYDGIREYDNPCPAWWYLLFLGTAVFSAFYYLFFQLGSFGWTVAQAHQAAVAEDLKRRFAEMGELEADEATLLKAMNDPEWLAVGESVYETQCKSCHGADGSGSVGPNLTDDHYKNVKELADIARVVVEGAANGAMPAWNARLHPNEIVLVSAYVASLRGKDLPGPRGAEGEVIPPWPTEPSMPPPEDQQSGSDPVEDPAEETPKVPSESE